MIQVTGYAAQQAKARLTQYSFERREPRAHDVVIDIEYSGICHSYVHQVNNGWARIDFSAKILLETTKE